MLCVGNPDVSGGIPPGDQGFFKQLFELSPDPAWVLDGNRFVDCNQAAIKTLGYSGRDELLNVHPAKLSPVRQPDGEDSYGKAERMMAIAKDRGLHRFEWLHTRADGSAFPAEVTLSRVRLSDRQVFYCVWRDISERKDSEQALKQSLKLLAETERVGNVGGWEFNIDTGIQTWTEQLYRIHEVDVELVPTVENGIGFYSPEFRPMVKEAVRRAVEHGERFGFDAVIITAKGNRRNVHATGIPDLEHRRIYGFFQDVTERIQAEAELHNANRRWQTTFDTTLDAICLLSSDQKILQANASMAALTGISVENMIGRHCWEIVHGTSQPIPQCPLKRARRSLNREQTELQIGNRWLNVTVDPVLGHAQAFQGAVHTIRDITEHRLAQEALAHSQQQYDKLVSKIPFGTYILRSRQDGSFALDFVSPRAAELFGISAERLLADATAVFQAIHPDDRDAFISLNQEGIVHLRPFEWTGRVQSEGQVRFFHIGSTPDPQVNGDVLWLGIAEDITERRHLEEQVRQLAFYDPLTLLSNRRVLTERLDQALLESKRSRHYGALIFLDLDKFKSLNDSHGHAAGDLLLVQAARRMKACVREIDTVARYGGDEFVVMMSDLNEDKAVSIALAVSAAEKIRAALAEPYRLAAKPSALADDVLEHHCTASIGLVVFIDREGTQDDFLRLADAAMYQAKKAGSNLIRVSQTTG